MPLLGPLWVLQLRNVRYDMIVTIWYENHTKRRQDVPHFGLKYLSNDGINRNRLYCENFLKVYTYGPAKIIGLIFSGLYL